MSAPQPPRGLLVVRIDVREGAEDDFNRWYDEEHIPERLAWPGFVSARRYRSAEHPRRYLAVYELDDPGVVTSEAYLSQPMSDWARRVMEAWQALDRSVWERL